MSGMKVFVAVAVAVGTALMFQVVVDRWTGLYNRGGGVGQGDVMVGEGGLKLKGYAPGGGTV